MLKPPLWAKKPEAVAREEWEEHDARLDEDDEEDAAVGHEGAGGDPAGDGRARILQKLGNKVNEAHSPSHLEMSSVKRRGIPELEKCPVDAAIAFLGASLAGHQVSTMGTGARQRPLMAAASRP